MSPACVVASDKMKGVSDSQALRPRVRKRTSARAIIGWSVTGVVVLLIGCVVWIGVRGLVAKADLEASVGLVSQIKTQVADGNVTAARTTSQRLATKVHAARDLTSDVIWRAAEILPLVGPSLVAVRQASGVVSAVTDKSIVPLARLADSFNLSSFKPVNGALPLKPLIAAAPTVAKANANLQAGLAQVQKIDTKHTLSMVDSAVQRLTGALESAGQVTEAAHRAIDLLPAMLGRGGPRNYVVMFQNNAELRSTGGIPGALALLHVDNGTIKMEQQASSLDFPHYAEPVLPLSPATRGLYGDITGEYVQDVNLTPQFPVSAELVQEMWKRQFGTQVDGVISIDPVALSYLLKATGPVVLATGDTLSAGNAVKLVLSDVYARYTDPAQQDEFFASAAEKVFGAVADGKFDPKTMIRALARAGAEHRVYIWSAHQPEQKSLEQTTLAGTLPASSNAEQRFGIYLNDATGAKMDYYLHASVGLGQATCRADRRPTYAVEVTLKSAAPADAATMLPAYVTGGGAFHVQVGKVRTNVAVYAPPGAIFLGARSGGERMPLVPADSDGRQLSQFQIELAPGQSETMQLQFLGSSAFSGDLLAQITPGVNPTETHRLDFHCESALK